MTAGGDVLRELKSDNITYRHGYQGQFAEKDAETGWSHFELREYDPVIGRWTAKDPMGQYWSPYVGMGNNPVGLIDPTGGCTDGNGNPIPCPDGIPEAGNEDLRVLDDVEIEGRTWNWVDELMFRIQNPHGVTFYNKECPCGVSDFGMNGTSDGAIYDPVKGLVVFKHKGKIFEMDGRTPITSSDIEKISQLISDGSFLLGKGYSLGELIDDLNNVNEDGHIQVHNLKTAPVETDTIKNEWGWREWNSDNVPIWKQYYRVVSKGDTSGYQYKTAVQKQKPKN